MWFGATEFLDSIELKIALPVAALFLTTKETAAAGLGLLFLTAVHFFPYVFVMRYLLPAVHRDSTTNATALGRTIDRWLASGAIVSVLGGTLFAFFGNALVAHLARGDYRDQQGMFVAVGIAMVPLCLSIVGSARFMTIEHQRALLAWRIQATIAFLLTLGVTAPYLGAAAPFVGVIASRGYLTVRFALERPRTVPRRHADGPVL